MRQEKASLDSLGLEGHSNQRAALTNQLQMRRGGAFNFTSNHIRRIAMCIFLAYCGATNQTDRFGVKLEKMPESELPYQN